MAAPPSHHVGGNVLYTSARSHISTQVMKGRATPPLKKNPNNNKKNNARSSKIDENNTLHLLTGGRFDRKGFKVQVILT